MLLFNCSVVSNSLWHRGLQHARLPCPSLSPREFARIQVHWVSDAIQLSYPLLPPSLPSFYLSQNQGLFQWVGSLQQVAKVLELQHQSFQLIFRLISFGIVGLTSLPSKGFSRVFSNTTIQKHQFFSTQPSLWSNCHILTWLLEKP